MSLRERIQRSKTTHTQRQRVLFEKYGLLENPFPAAGQPFGHPHLATDIDENIENCIDEFENGTQKTQVLVIEGTQGVGKTNLLNYYQRELADLYQDDKTFYIIRYYPDPEPSFDAIIRKIFQELEENHLVKIAHKLRDSTKRLAIIDIAKGHEMRLVLHSLWQAAEKGEAHLKQVSVLAMEWLLGLRLLKQHKETLGVRFRLDTVESKTQALRDIIYVSVELGILRGIFLLLDELEKQHDSLSKTPAIRYLSAIRALIDALPTHLFLMLALTLEARRRYFTMLPAMAGRLQNVNTLNPIEKANQALELYQLYLENARIKAKTDKRTWEWKCGNYHLFSEHDISLRFQALSARSANIGIKGIIHRDFLNELHESTQAKFREIFEEL
ncbi:hypothetical protein PN36_32365 [Candidatus Thiomargarita nelsonii]|uniref:Orc1-like AAA ATPase domain-containing protein n=1 Tax=Candidatus Thiomargarita nelsonii TaxID=1003181 RepID=A0A0A6P5X6_9GAMM|nr:hypothetical protein PN36_32365 [Candidatus Thiomargarita nelsonii]